MSTDLEHRFRAVSTTTNLTLVHLLLLTFWRSKHRCVSCIYSLHVGSYYSYKTCPSPGFIDIDIVQ